MNPVTGTGGMGSEGRLEPPHHWDLNPLIKIRTLSQRFEPCHRSRWSWQWEEARTTASLRFEPSYTDSNLVTEIWTLLQRFEPCHRSRWSGHWGEERTTWSVRPSTRWARPSWLLTFWKPMETVSKQALFCYSQSASQVLPGETQYRNIATTTSENNSKQLKVQKPVSDKRYKKVNFIWTRLTAF